MSKYDPGIGVIECGVCGDRAPISRVIDGFRYSDCPSCGCIAIERRGIEQLESGQFPVRYDEAYWRSEYCSATERAWGDSFARAAEAILYCRRPIKRFVDIGTGTGELLDALSAYLPSHAPCFFGVEQFPPVRRSSHPNYIQGDLGSAGQKFDSGVCIEVVEHLTPAGLRRLAADLAAASNPEALYLFNTGLAPYVRAQDPGYIDPLGRGHIISWGMRAIADIFEPQGFRIWPVRGKGYAFVAEFESACGLPLEDRIWTAPNAGLLRDPRMGSIPYLLGRESVLAH